MHPFSTPRKQQRRLLISDVFMGRRKSALGTNGLTPNQGSFSAWGEIKEMSVNFHFIKKKSRSFVGRRWKRKIYIITFLLADIVLCFAVGHINIFLYKQRLAENGKKSSKY